ncbi:LPXTG cell wall anchor domain-containing protein [Streptococcus penaeicida]|nr:LPXTG cell wall anchor domain-containing protein [Streptococcus penaeicida]
MSQNHQLSDHVELPHTGSNENSGLYGSTTLAILAALGLSTKKRKNEK